MFSIDHGSFEPVVFTLGSDDEEDGGDNHSEVSGTKTAEELCFTVANSGRNPRETYDILQSYNTKLIEERDRLWSGFNEREQKLNELRKQKQELEQIRDQLDSRFCVIERRLFLLSEDNLKRFKIYSKSLRYKEVLQQIVDQIPVQNQDLLKKVPGFFRRLYLKLKKCTS